MYLLVEEAVLLATLAALPASLLHHVNTLKL